MNFRDYKRKLRKRASDDNWETEEVSRWIANDEGIYEAAYNAVRRDWQNPAGALRSIVEEYGVPNVDFNAVDWDALVAEVDDDSAEQMGYDAQAMLAQDQPGDTYLPEGWTSKVANEEPDWENWPVAQNASDPYLEAQHGPWRSVWNGGRLMDIYHAESPTAVDAIEAGHYDWENAGPFSGAAWHEPPTQEGVNQRLHNWANEYGGDYERNVLPYQ